MTLEIDQFQFTLDTALRNEKTLRYAADAAYEERFERHEAQLDAGLEKLVAKLKLFESK